MKVLKRLVRIVAGILWMLVVLIEFGAEWAEQKLGALCEWSEES